MIELSGQQVLMRIFIGEADKHEGKVLYQWLVETMRKEKLCGATVLRGILGYGANSQIKTAHILQLSQDLPIVVEVIDTPQNIERILPIIAPAVKNGLITTEKVQIVKYGVG